MRRIVEFPASPDLQAAAMLGFELARKRLRQLCDGKIEDPELVLCEDDSRTVIVFSNWSSDRPASVTFQLPRPVSQREFEEFGFAQRLEAD